NRAEPRDMLWLEVDSIVRQTVGGHFSRISVMSMTKEEQCGVIRFSVAEDVGVRWSLLDCLCAVIKREQFG
ncbi:hypothetical protein AVEN_141041-1, partial [Araneus ventricosus]